MAAQQGKTSRPARDPARSREAILVAASAEFAAHGFAGARLDAVAQQCGIVKGLIFHYFPSKRALYVAALERIYAALRQRQNETSLAGLGPEAAMRRLAVETFRCFRDMPEVVALMNEENLHRGQNLHGVQSIPALYNPLIAAISRLLDQGCANGDFRPGIDPVAFYIALSGLGYFYCANRHTLGNVFQTDLFTPERVAAFETLIGDMVVAALRPLAV